MANYVTLTRDQANSVRDQFEQLRDQNDTIIQLLAILAETQLSSLLPDFKATLMNQVRELADG